MTTRSEDVSPVPTPVAAAIGLVPTVLDGVRRLPGKAVQLPVLAVSHALTTLETVRREYDALAERGERFLGRAPSFDELEDRVEDALPAPLAKPYDAVEDTVEDAVSKVTDLLDRAATRTPKAQQPKGEPTPPAPTGGVERHDTAAAPEDVEKVELVATAVGTGVPAHDELPLPDYDHMTLGSLRGRLRSLSVEQLVQVRDYEKAHADRLPVVTLLDNRIAKLATDAAAAPSPGGELPVLPAAAAAPKVTDATAAVPKKAPRKKVRTT